MWAEQWEEVYTVEWLIQLMLSIRMAKDILPEYWLSDDEPVEINKIKKRINRIIHELQGLEMEIYELKEVKACEQNKRED